MADAEMATPSLEGGQSDVTVSADGVIEVTMP
jgi:predicted secreted protein